MISVHYGKKHEPAFKLEASEDMIAVRTYSRESIRSMDGVATASQKELVDDSMLVTSFPEADVEVLRIVPTARSRSIDARKVALREIPDVRFAGSVLVDPGTGEPVVYTENIFVKFDDGMTRDICRAILRDHGLAIKHEPEYAKNAFFASAPEGSGQQVFDIADRILARDDVEYSHPEIIRRKAKKRVFDEQWHLKPTVVGGHAINAHANVEAAHAITLGANVTIAIIDDGVDIEHPEFSGDGKVVSPWDSMSNGNDPRPRVDVGRYPDNHGTACAGVACANGQHGASGVAPSARLMPIRQSANLGSVLEADAFHWAVDHGADIISCSWGPADGHWELPNDLSRDHIDALPAHTRLAIEHAVTHGRNGKGCIILFAAGNGNESMDTDQYASNPNVIAVAACNDRSVRSAYSDFGAAVWCAFPSDDAGSAVLGVPAPLTPGIWTTDRLGTKGYNPGNVALGDGLGNFINRFGGTSSACPGAAGVAALVLAVNPGLTWRQVKDVLARCCDRIDPQGGHYDAITGHSRFYGHGRLNALRAVQLSTQQPSLESLETADALP